MHLSLTEEQALIQSTARRFAQSELAANANLLDRHEGREAFLRNLKSLANLGFMGLNVKTEYGGSEVGVVAFSVAVTELSRACASTAVTLSVSNMVAEIIQAVGSDSQKDTYLPKICGGDYAAAGFCLTESGAGSDPAAMSTTAVREGEDWILNGSKIFVTSAEYAGIFVVWAVTDANAAKQGISCFLVEAGNSGISIGKPENKMGQVGSSTNSIHFENCRVSATALLGREGQGFKLAVGELAGGRIGIASLALGVGLAAMDYAREYLGEREQFGQKIGNFQGLQWMVADRYTELEAARLLTMKAAFEKEQGLAFSTAASMAKLFSSEKANDACYSAIQILGGAGYTKDLPLERMARDVRVTTIYEGTSEIQRVIISRDLLREVN
ncbi:MAG: acyl-CoA dehydrogenase [SAR86 cluster bacterium]|uniref:3-sulfinopropanoyl-CoA desulfinase n=1 Tax=SAR86 cluster bacterium TaxID=2030880 RepID=A0A2A4XIK9_9GAMM|nr:MAG: acyl-CoA dehydrogenase [SAR86 cluster bacterium]